MSTTIDTAGQPDAKNWAVSALIAKWGIDQLLKKGVAVTLGKDRFQFVQQPDGSFTAPASCTMTLLVIVFIFVFFKVFIRTVPVFIYVISGGVINTILGLAVFEFCLTG